MVDIHRYRHRLAGIGLGLLLIIWLPTEDTSTRALMGLAAILSVWLGVRWWLNRKEGLPGWHFLLAGLLTGLAVPIVALLFIAIKAGLHAHGFTDFAPSQLSAILLSAPWWVISGLLAGYFSKRLNP